MDTSSDTPAADENTHTTNRGSARGNRIEIITRGESRGSWTVRQKREIVAESLGLDLTPAEVARKYAIGTGLLYTWRRRFLTVPGPLVTRAAAHCAAPATTSVKKVSIACRGGRLPSNRDIRARPRWSR